MKILLQKGVLDLIGLHRVVEPKARIKNSDRFARQKIYAADRKDLRLRAENYDYDCAVLQVSTLEERFEQLRDTVRELHDQLPVGILNYGGITLSNKFLRVAGAGKYPVRIKGMQQEGASAELPAFLASLSGAFYGNENPILELGNNYTLDRVQRQIFDPNGDTVSIKPVEFRIIEYLAHSKERPVLVDNVASYIWDMTDNDIENMQNSHAVTLAALRQNLNANSQINILSRNEGIPYKFTCLSEHGHFADTFKVAIEKLDDSLKDKTGFIIPLDDGQKLLRVGGLRFHTAYTMLLVDGAVDRLTEKEWKAMVSVVKSGSAGVSKENLNIRDNEHNEEYTSDSEMKIVIAMISKVRAKLHDYKNIIPCTRGRGSRAIYKIDSKACEASEKAYFARMTQQKPDVPATPESFSP